MRLLVSFSLVVSGAVAWLLFEGESSANTGLLFLLSVGSWFAVAAHLIIRARRMSPKVILAVGSSVVMLIGLELFLRYGLGTHATYGEQNGSRTYRSIYTYDNPTWFHKYQPNVTERWVKTEFTHERRTNSLGLADREVPVAKSGDEYRVIALGDSFTEGVGGSIDETWVSVFERQVHAPAGRTVRAMNAGVSGSDLLFEYVLLRDQLRPYKPNLVIVAVNNSDVVDVITRGGMERFLPNGKVQGRRGPAWDWLYGISYITRYVVHDVLGYSWLLMRPATRADAETAAAGTLRSTLTAMSRLSADLGAGFLLVFHPHEYEVRAGTYQPPAFARLVEEVTAARDMQAVDLLQVYAREGTLTPANANGFYWPIDFHHNARGYALMGRMIADEVTRRRLIAAPVPQ